MSRAAVQRPPPPSIEDPTVYPVSDGMGDPTLQTLISFLLLGLLRRWLASQGKPTFVGISQFFYWKQFDPSEGLAPDLYVLPGVPLSPRVGAWKLWEMSTAPTFALEIVSRDVDKDYLVNPPKYDRLGVKELIIFDPDHTAGADRVRFQIFRRVKSRGLLRVEATNADRVRSRVLGCFLRVVGEGDEVRLRLGTGPSGDTLLPTDEEARQQAEVDRAQAAADAERAHAERAQAEAEAERALREAQAERAEAERAHAEAERAQAERIQAEVEAERAQAGRIQAEAEATRAQAGRVQAEAEATRAHAERTQAEAEAERALREAQAERAEAERAQAEAERAQAEAAALRVERDEALAELARLRAEIAAQRRGKR